MRQAIGFIFGTLLGLGVGYTIGKRRSSISEKVCPNNNEEPKKPDDKIDDDIPENKKDPVVIPPELFGEEPDFEKRTFTLWSDGVLTDEQDIKVDDISIIGNDSLNHFGEYENDAVYVKNEELETYYEILVDYRPYHDKRTVKDDD